MRYSLPLLLASSFEISAPSYSAITSFGAKSRLANSPPSHRPPMSVYDA